MLETYRGWRNKLRINSGSSWFLLHNCSTCFCHFALPEFCTLIVKIKVMFTLEQGTKAQMGSWCIALLFPQPRRYMGSGWSTSRHGRFTPGKDPAPIVYETGWAPGPLWTGAENLAPTGIRSPDRLARSESLYRLSYPGPYLHSITSILTMKSLLSSILHMRVVITNLLSSVTVETRVLCFCLIRLKTVPKLHKSHNGEKNSTDMREYWHVRRIHSTVEQDPMVIKYRLCHSLTRELPDIMDFAYELKQQVAHEDSLTSSPWEKLWVLSALSRER